MLVLAPIVISYQAQEMVAKREILNEVVQFIDRVTDKASIEPEDEDDLSLGINTHGGVYNVKVRRYIRVATEDRKGEVRTLYYTSDALEVLNVGDVVQVEVTGVGISKAMRIYWWATGVDKGEFKFTLAGTVR